MAVSDEGPVLLSDTIVKELGIDVSVLMGANVATEVAQEVFAEATVGYRNENNGLLFKKLFSRPYFNVGMSNDVAGVELCGASKNVVALAAGFCDGLGYGGNTKAAIIRIGLQEMKEFAKLFYPEVKEETFFESCGIADVLVTCLEGRNRKVAEAFAKTGKSFDELEKELLNGQKLQGTLTSDEMHQVLKKKDLQENFPLFTTVWEIVYGNHQVENLIPRMMGRKHKY